CRVGLHAGLLAAALGGLDAFMFTAGIGENSPSLRARIVEKLAWLGGKLDPQANAAAATSIAARDSGIGLYVVPTDEELMIARHTLALLTDRGAKRAALSRQTLPPKPCSQTVVHVADILLARALRFHLQSNAASNAELTSGGGSRIDGGHHAVAPCSAAA